MRTRINYRMDGCEKKFAYIKSTDLIIHISKPVERHSKTGWIAMVPLCLSIKSVCEICISFSFKFV
jgi:hypothetical protein